LIAEKHNISNPRVFGSVARGQDSHDSDIDFLVDAGPGCSLLDVGGMIADLEDVFGRRVDVRTINDLHPKMRPTVLAEAISL
jgi:predicted nucleotidyltransferase